ncbi:pentatricopeptide repeat-containing protein At4g16470 [Henckelia pumila]|uniref:pentatricopeptide repeat-containing protein At4g16470 n=1 Tax=Henckelia pumila TaxID=405737 RepID=UPI003C6E34DE
MLTISRVKPLLSVYKPPAAAAISRGKVESLRFPCFLPVITPLPSIKPAICVQSRGLCTDVGATGEIHVIVGPMFAGKTTTLLKRIKSESFNGRFQAADAGKNYYHLDKTLKGLCFTGRVKEAVRLLCCSGVQVHSETYCLLLQECISRKEYREGRRIHWQMVAVGFVPDEYLNIKLLILYAKAGDLDTAHILFDSSSCFNLVSWNAMISGYVQKGQDEVGLSFYNSMRLCGLIPDQYTFASVFRACSSLAILEQGKQAHGLLTKSRFSKNVVVCTSLMDMYFKCSSSYDASLVFDKCLERNVITWTALISGYGFNGRVVDVLGSFHQMINEGFRPNEITFLAVLSACSHGGLVNEGREYFSSMIRDYGVKPRGRHYAAIVDLLGRGGRLEEAYAFVQMSPFKKHPAVWGALLGACKIHGNVEMVKLAAKKFFELEPENAGKYIVLCNAYATFGLWDNVAEVRSMMKGCGIKKEPGYSMVEVQMEAHFFFMGHNTHKQTKQICGLIEDLTCILKDNCDVRDFSIELQYHD